MQVKHRYQQQRIHKQVQLLRASQIDGGGRAKQCALVLKLSPDDLHDTHDDSMMRQMQSSSNLPVLRAGLVALWGARGSRDRIR